jgi:hypothetical protein
LGYLWNPPVAWIGDDIEQLLDTVKPDDELRLLPLPPSEVGHADKFRRCPNLALLERTQLPPMPAVPRRAETKSFVHSAFKRMKSASTAAPQGVHFKLAVAIR